MEALIKDLEAITIVDELGKWNRELKTYEPVNRHPHVFQWGVIQTELNPVRLSAEDGGYFCDYYGEYRGGYPWVHPEVEAVAAKHGMFIEWYDPSHIAFYAI